jgi:hypothetical protein
MGSTFSTENLRHLEMGELGETDEHYGHKLLEIEPPFEEEDNGLVLVVKSKKKTFWGWIFSLFKLKRN